MSVFDWIGSMLGRRNTAAFSRQVEQLAEAIRAATSDVDIASMKMSQLAAPDAAAPRRRQAPAVDTVRGISLAGLAAVVPALEAPAEEQPPISDVFGLAAGAWAPPSPADVRQHLSLNLFREFFSGQIVEESQDAETGEWRVIMRRRLSNGERQAGRRHLQRAGVRATVREVGGDTWSEPARLSWPRPGTTETVQVTDTLRRDYGN